jgi:hypothetical protein
MAEYDAQKLALTLELDVDNEEVLLQFSLETGMGGTVAGCEEAIIATAVGSVRSEIQQSHYRTAGNPWEKGDSEVCPCVQVSNSWKQKLDYIGPLSSVTTLKLLRDFHYGTKDARTTVCRLHLQKLGQRLGLLTDHLAIGILLGRVNTMYDYRFRLGFLKTDSTSAGWFVRFGMVC